MIKNRSPRFLTWISTIKRFVLNGAFVCLLLSGFSVLAEQASVDPVKAELAQLNVKKAKRDVINATEIFTFVFLGGQLEQALLQLAQQTNMQLVMRSVSSKASLTPLTLTAPLSDILTTLLTDSGFEYQLLFDEQVILISLKAAVLQPNDALSTHGEQILENDAWEHILITAQGSQHRSILASSTSVTYLNRDKLAKLSRESTAEILQQVPGFWVEGSGGETNNNVAPRGLRGGEGFRFISLMMDGLPVVYDGVWPDFFLRQDLMTAGVETIRGGNSAILTVNGPAAVVNFISEKGSDVSKNQWRFSQGVDHDFTRIDALSSGAITDNWYYALGGFYRFNDGVRSPGYIADKGGQVTLNLTKRFTQGEANFSLKHLNDTTTFFPPIAMTNAEEPQAISGINANYGTLLSSDFNQLHFKTPEGIVVRDIDDGQKTKMTRFDMNLQWDISDIVHLNNKFSVADMANTMYAMMNLGNDTILNATEQLNSPFVQNFINKTQAEHPNKIIKAAYSYSHDQSIVNAPEHLNGNGLVTFAYPLYSHYQQQQWLNHLNADIELEHWRLSFGHILALNSFDSLPLDKWQGEILTEVKHQPKRLDIVALDQESQIIETYSENGFTSYAGPGYLDGDGRVLSHSLYGNIEWQPLDKLIVDLGIRLEHLSLQSSASTDKIYDLDDSQFQAVYKSDYTFTKKESFTELAWSVGGNYQLTKQSALFFHFASGFEMPKLITFGNEIGWGDYLDSIPAEVGFGEPVTLNFAEGGLRMADNNWRMTATLFETRFNPLAFTVFRGLYDNQESLFIDTNTRGVEFEFDINLTDRFHLSGLGVWQKAIFSGIPNALKESTYNGNQITRTPELQLRLMPSYQFDNSEVFMTLAYIGKRYSDIANRFALPAYTVVDLGISTALTDNIKLALLAKNITNTVGITEGNPRDGIAYSDNANFYTRAIFGRSMVFNIELSF
ncbi:TonB-dependent receptor [Colwellia asteriadis]|uniref:TonB-dependent receptor n=1 Tax=Colwellia asteriadis TaxID=517723 RepID=UPI0031D4BB79